MTDEEKRAEIARLRRRAEESRGMAEAAHGVGCTLDGNEYARLAQLDSERAQELAQELESHNSTQGAQLNPQC